VEACGVQSTAEPHAGEEGTVRGAAGVCVCICLYVDVCLYMCVYVYVFIYVYVCVHVYICMCIYIYICMGIYMCVLNPLYTTGVAGAATGAAAEAVQGLAVEEDAAQVCVCLCMYVCMYIYMCVFLHIYVCVMLRRYTFIFTPPILQIFVNYLYVVYCDGTVRSITVCPLRVHVAQYVLLQFVRFASLSYSTYCVPGTCNGQTVIVRTVPYINVYRFLLQMHINLYTNVF
jgi:hypothetical protein